jgi:hypothetical protein
MEQPVPTNGSVRKDPAWAKLDLRMTRTLAA